MVRTTARRGFLAAWPLAQVDLVDTDCADVWQLVETGLADISCKRQVGPLLRNGRVPSPIVAAFRQHLTRSIGALTAQFGLLPVSDP